MQARAVTLDPFVGILPTQDTAEHRRISPKRLHSGDEVGDVDTYVRSVGSFKRASLSPTGSYLQKEPSPPLEGLNPFMASQEAARLSQTFATRPALSLSQQTLALELSGSKDELGAKSELVTSQTMTTHSYLSPLPLLNENPFMLEQRQNPFVLGQASAMASESPVTGLKGDGTFQVPPQEPESDNPFVVHGSACYLPPQPASEAPSRPFHQAILQHTPTMTINNQPALAVRSVSLSPLESGDRSASDRPSPASSAAAGATPLPSNEALHDMMDYQPSITFDLNETMTGQGPLSPVVSGLSVGKMNLKVPESAPGHSLGPLSDPAAGSEPSPAPNKVLSPTDVLKMAGTPHAPPHGAKALCGKRTNMEDAFSVQMNFFDVTQAEDHHGSNKDATGADVAMMEDEASPVNRFPPRLAQKIEPILQEIDFLKVKLAAEAPQVVSNASSSTSSHLTSSSPVSTLPSAFAHSTSMKGNRDQETVIAHDSSDMLHFFAVFDGHGGDQAANHCASRLHEHLSAALTAAGKGENPLAPPDVGHSGERGEDKMDMDGSHGSIDPQGQGQGQGQGQATEPLTQYPPKPLIILEGLEEGDEGTASSLTPKIASLHLVDDTNLLSSPAAMRKENKDEPGLVKLSSNSGPLPSLNAQEEKVAAPQRKYSKSFRSMKEAKPGFISDFAFEKALREAFIKTDEEFAATDISASTVGTTAVVALVGKRKIYIANCGDSRAVLCRQGKALQMTDDHKPEREDEALRVEQAGGQVLYWNGHRVMGILAMSRAIGDVGLRPYVIPEPEVTMLSRCDEDDFLLLASDGLWDVMENQEAVDLAVRCLSRAGEKGASRKSAVRIAANVLTKAAIDRGSKDNVTVVVVDLKLNPSTSSTPPSSKASIVSKEEPKSTEEIPQQQQPDPPPSVNLAPLHISLPPHSAFGPSVHFSPTVVSSPSTPNPFAQASSTIEESTSAADPAPGPGPGPADPDMSPAAANTESHVDASPFGSVGLMLQEEEPMNPFISAFQQQGGQEQGSSLS